MKILEQMGIEVHAYVTQIGDIQIDPVKMTYENIEKSPLRMPDLEASERAEEFLKNRI